MASITAEFRHTSRDAMLHITTTLSRSWDRLSHFFGHLRDAVAYERLMHASFDWALSPLQRLMPSATWPAVHLHGEQWGQPTRGAGAVPGGDMFALATAWWRGFAAPSLTTGPRSRLNRPATHPAVLAFAPMFGAAALMPAFGFGLSF